MICPYIESCHYHEQTNVVSEDNPELIEKYTMSDVYLQMKCKEKGCAVWYEGRCHYNG